MDIECNDVWPPVMQSYPHDNSQIWTFQKVNSFETNLPFILTKQLIIMTHSLTPTVAPISAVTPPSQKILAAHRNSILRRDVLVGAVFGVSILGDKSADAAARRPPPPPPTEKEKKDPNVSGVLAKVIASKKRKEAMKQTMAQLRNKGKPINQPSPSPSPAD
ncbi:hypothetical protein R6Q59_028596 [Mikania micrantha]